jgi:hypothetical protein
MAGGAASADALGGRQLPACPFQRRFRNAVQTESWRHGDLGGHLVAAALAVGPSTSDPKANEVGPEGPLTTGRGPTQ